MQWNVWYWTDFFHEGMNPDWEKNDTTGEKYTGLRSLWISDNQNVLFLREVEVFMCSVSLSTHHGLNYQVLSLCVIKLELERKFLLVLQDFSWDLLVYMFIHLDRFCSIIKLHCKNSSYHLIKKRVREEMVSFRIREIHSGKGWKHGNTKETKKYQPWLWPQGRCPQKSISVALENDCCLQHLKQS